MDDCKSVKNHPLEACGDNCVYFDKTPDFEVQNHGSIFILTPCTEAADQWVNDHIPEDAPMWGPNGIAVEHRYIADIVAGIQNDGLTVI